MLSVLLAHKAVLAGVLYTLMHEFVANSKWFESNSMGHMVLSMVMEMLGKAKTTDEAPKAE